MSLDKFGRFSLKPQSEIKGVKGEGFILNAEGNFDIKRKKLCNVLDPTDDGDVVNLKTLNQYASNTLQIDGSNYDAKNRLITGVGDATNDFDAVSLRYIKNHTITTNKLNKLDANNMVITNVGTPSVDADVVTLKFLKNHTLFLHKEIDAKHKIIKNVARPKDSHDAINYIFFMEMLATLSYAIYLKLNENKKKKFTRLEWLKEVLSNLKDWNDLFEATEN